MTSNHNPAVALGIDIGTSGARAAAIDRNGAPLGFSAAPFSSPDELRRPSAWWDKVAHAVERLAIKVNLSSVEGVAVDGTSGTVLALDSKGEPTGGVLMYNEPCPDPMIVDRIASHAPKSSTAVGANSGLARALFLSSQPGVATVVHQSDWILAKLGCPDHVSDENNALKTGYDLGLEQWPDWIQAAGMDTSKLPKVFRAGARIASVDGFVREIGIPSSAWFHAGTTDGCASFLATGASATGDAVTALGSTIVLKLASEMPITAPQYGVYSHRVGGFWLVGGASNSGGNVLRALIGDDRLEALTQEIDPNRNLGLDFYPLLRPGERFPINDPHYVPRLTPRPVDDGMFFQAILEGMTEIERLGYQRLRELGAPPVATLRTVGGGSMNSEWTRMRSKAIGVATSPARSLEAAVGTAALVLSNLECTHG